MKTNIYLVRHAHSIYTPEEHVRPLSDKGRGDAERVTKLLLGKEIDCIFSSPYKRAIETVQGIADHFGLNIKEIDGFKERRLATASVENFDAAITKVWKDFTVSLDGGESNYIAQKRGVEALEQVLHEYKGKNIIIGTHGNIMVLIMNYYNNQYGYKFWRNLDMPDIYHLIFDDTRLVKVHRVWHRE